MPVASSRARSSPSTPPATLARADRSRGSMRGDRVRARQLAEQARGAIADLRHKKEQRAEIEAWLRAQP